MPPAPIPPPNLLAIRRKLDRLAEIARGGVDVHAMLEAERVATRSGNGGETMERKAVASVTVRCAPDLLTEADRLAEELADTPEARAAGGHWGRAAVLRLALDRGLRSLAEERAAQTTPAGRADGVKP
jgi:hypothetical protein